MVRSYHLSLLQSIYYYPELNKWEVRGSGRINEACFGTQVSLILETILTELYQLLQGNYSI